MRLTILFGGINRERLVSVATAQALNAALPEADLWFWQPDGSVRETTPEFLQAHARPFEEPFRPQGRVIGALETALDLARRDDRLLVLGLHGGMAENGELQAMCEARGVVYTGSGSASSHLAFDKIAAKRFAAYAGQDLVGVLFVAPEPIEVSRDWLAERSGLPFANGFDRLRVLSGRPGSGQPDPGPLVCACFSVGTNIVMGAIRGGASTVEEVGAAVRAGTNCGSCRSEVRRLIQDQVATL